MIEELQDFLLTRLGRVKDMLERAAAGPLLVRFMLFLLTLVAALVAFPPDVILRPAAVVFTAVLAALPAVFPRTRLVGLAILLCAFGWLLGSYFYDQVVTIPRVIALATALYLVHSLAALAAALPYDAIVSPGVILAWLLRATAIVSASAIVSVLILAVVKLVIGPVFLAASLVGLLAAAGLAWIVTRKST
ncbi:hypothetical protein Daura_47400 [Dactylosporangium aurantiacum]|uniref:Uncharacterized protein n=1 Tax=Dactylosporangium aurantiacum TaxID=35754 RepID=A0A9Q9IJ49_9ACTN|nr:hypothetical protein [Dactylosporangium aurantiacum]MDG6105432.1 hypothetical protein [Dactylosporangium aurantiacum]UWZ54028.1 hypothetical protein Daura_47400 [Dactylosporangium aurantiacum]